MNDEELATTFMVALCVILATCWVVARLVRPLLQPPVVGEMIAGVLLGPSLLGLLAPGVQEALFPAEMKSLLFTLSQIGVAFYMFLVGLEFDARMLRGRMRSAASVSLAGILAPLILGGLLAWYLLESSDRYFTAGVTLPQAMLFIGAAVATTAFPMLARIIKERGIAGTTLGTLSLGAGAFGDAVSWCILAVVLAVFKGDPSVALVAVGGGVAYAVLVATVGRRLLRPLARSVERGHGITPSVLAIVLVLILLASWYTNTVGIHAIFGAFLLGAAMPRGAFGRQLEQVLEPMVKGFLLPMFFVYSGLNTQLGLVNSLALWGVVAIILTVSILGKGVACWGAARLAGVPSREAMAIGSLMNARGLIELILLNIGLQAGFITPTLFTIMVLMAVVTTLMCAPVFEFVYGRHHRVVSARVTLPPGPPAGPVPAQAGVVA